MGIIPQQLQQQALNQLHSNHRSIKNRLLVRECLCDKDTSLIEHNKVATVFNFFIYYTRIKIGL